MALTRMSGEGLHHQVVQDLVRPTLSSRLLRVVANSFSSVGLLVLGLSVLIPSLIVGGEFSSLYQNSFHHYRDFWCGMTLDHSLDPLILSSGCLTSKIIFGIESKQKSAQLVVRGIV